MSRSPEPGVSNPGVGGPVMRSNSTSSATSASITSTGMPTSTLAAALLDSHHSSTSNASNTGSPRQTEHRFKGKLLLVICLKLREMVFRHFSSSTLTTQCMNGLSVPAMKLIEQTIYLYYL